MTMTSPQTFPYRRPVPAGDIAGALPKGHVLTLFGQVERVDVGWGGQLRCRLRLSVGTLTITGTRETVLLDAKPGDWLRVRVRRSFGSDAHAPEVRLLGARLAEPDVKLAWVPTSRYHRHAHMQRLRTLLAKLAPVLQLVFMQAMACDAQRAFFWRVGAADHHGYPGGLFDYSVAAAELAHAQPHDSERDRGIATLAALLFDLGKTQEGQLVPDRRRLSLPAPHALTGRRVTQALDALESFEPHVVGELRLLLTATPATALPASTARLAAKVHAAVGKAWFPEAPDAR